MSVVASIAGIYCSSEQVGRQVAGRLEYTWVDEAVLADLAAELGVSGAELIAAFTDWRTPSSDYLANDIRTTVLLKAAMALLVSKDNVVFTGPFALTIPAEITHVLRVCLVGDRGFRNALAAERDGLGPSQAEDLIIQCDQRLASWSQVNWGSGPWHAALYDVKLPMTLGHLPPAVDVICEAVAKTILCPTGRSIQATLDFLLSTQINLTLFNRGHRNCHVTSNRGDVTVYIEAATQSARPSGLVTSPVQLEDLQREIKSIAACFQGAKTVRVVPEPGREKPAATLLVDDEREYVFALSQRLRLRDIASDVAYDGFEALEAVEAGPPDVMVLDLKMPGIDGLEVLRRVRRKYPQIQVIVVTGLGSIEDERLARELGAFDYLQKPVDINVLSKTIKRASALAKGPD